VRGEGLPSIDASWNQYENGRPNRAWSARAQVMKDALFMHTEAKAALSNLKAAQQLASTAQLATESLQRKYDQGAADLVQMSQSMSALTQARSELVKCWTEWQAARLKLVLNH
jgi:outer membrane protein